MSETAPTGEAGPATHSAAQRELLVTVRLLAEQIGPRPSAGEGERKAAAYMIDQLRRAGYEVALEPFAGLTSFSWVYGLIYGLLAAAGLAGRRRPGLGAVLGLGVFGAFLAETLGWEVVARLPGLPRGRSQNVVARLPARDGAPATGPAPRVVLVAHLDSARAALLFHPRVAPMFRRNFVVLTVAQTTVALGGLLRWLWPGGGRPRALDRAITAAAAYLLVPFAILVHREVAMPVVPGANDNASGAAVVLAAALRLAARRREAADHGAEIWVVFTGCEESGVVGMQRFFHAHAAEFDPATTVFLNVDNVGAGTLTLVNQEGVFWPLLADAELLDTAGQVARRRGLNFQTHGYHNTPTDAQMPLSRGHRALTVVALDEHGHFPNWHWMSDTLAALDPATMEAALTLVVALVLRLATAPAARSG